MWDSYDLSKLELRTCNFNQDNRGRWYLNVIVQVETKVGEGKSSVGVDLGLKECAVASDGSRIENRFYKKYEKDLAKAQRANKKKRAKAIHTKIKNCRKDTLHKFSSQLVAENAAIFIGNVSSKKLIKTKMAKSVLDKIYSIL